MSTLNDVFIKGQVKNLAGETLDKLENELGKTAYEFASDSVLVGRDWKVSVDCEPAEENLPCGEDGDLLYSGSITVYICVLEDFDYSRKGCTIKFNSRAAREAIEEVFFQYGVVDIETEY